MSLGNHNKRKSLYIRFIVGFMSFPRAKKHTKCFPHMRLLYYCYILLNIKNVSNVQLIKSQVSLLSSQVAKIFFFVYFNAQCSFLRSAKFNIKLCHLQTLFSTYMYALTKFTKPKSSQKYLTQKTKNLSLRKETTQITAKSFYGFATNAK